MKMTSDDSTTAKIATRRAAIAEDYLTWDSFDEQQLSDLGPTLVTLIVSQSETHVSWIERERVHCISPDTRLNWAIDVLVLIQANSYSDKPVADALLAQLRLLAEETGEQRLWDAWAAGARSVCRWLDEDKRAPFITQLQDCAGTHASPAVRLALARTLSHELGKHPVASILEVMSYIRTLAERHGEPALDTVWAETAANVIWRTQQQAPAVAEQIFVQLDDFTKSSQNPKHRTIWASAVYRRLTHEDYVAADPARARAQLDQIRPLLGRLVFERWPEAAVVVHKVLVKKDLNAAAALRAELKAAAAASGNQEDLRNWLDACVAEITARRLTDYAAARALYAEMRAHAIGATDYHSKHAFQSARDLIEDYEFKVDQGLVKELLQPLELTALAKETGDDLHVSRLDASHAPDLTTVGHRIRCRDMILANTAIEAIPDDVQVTQHLDVSNCRNLKRLPRGLKVGRLTARTCLALETLPEGLNVGYLDLTGCTALKTLPADLVVRHGALMLRGCLHVPALPDSIRQIAHLDISGCPGITSVPPSLMVTASIDVGGSGLTAMPPHLADVPIRWYGVPVDERIAFRPETLDVQEILGEHNAELRRVMMERFGFEQFMTKAKAEVLDRDRDSGGPRSLLRVAVPNDEPLVCVSVICPSTKRQFMLRVPPTMRSCRQAIAWTAGYDNPDDYQPMVET
ncbi:DUF6745 domain-containing protein [Bradyrhizobium sp. HKCCYLS20291]|uniref:DUF6745 domain-containing protein n=1 Tax=Bradyrhizobium sp. HKCCYLS20291 TaxID=3420766 RepID=UPI003EBCEB9C